MPLSASVVANVGLREWIVNSSFANPALSRSIEKDRAPPRPNCRATATGFSDAAHSLSKEGLAAALTWQGERLQRCQPPRQSENMTTVVQKQPLRQGCLELCLGQILGAHQPEHRWNEVREGHDPLHDDDRGRAEPPITPWSPVQPGSDQIGEREQREGHRRHVDPKLEAGVGPHLRWNGLPPRDDDSRLVDPRAERDAEVYDKQPQQDLRYVLSHFIYLLVPCFAWG